MTNYLPFGSLYKVYYNNPQKAPMLDASGFKGFTGLIALLPSTGF